MDSLLTSAARALSAGDPLAALKRVALRADPAALAFRGIAMAQLGELDKSRDLLRRAARGFGSREQLSRARCLASEAEVALAQRDLAGSERAIKASLRALERLGDRVNAVHVRLVAIRRFLLIGRLDEAERALAALDVSKAPPTLAAIAHLVTAEVALRRVKTKTGRAALERARADAERARVPSLIAEVERTIRALEAPSARLIRGGRAKSVTIEHVEGAIDSGALVIDACRLVVRLGERSVSLATRPVLFALARELGEAWPEDVARDRLASRAFETRVVNETHRARLRVELGRLRRLTRDFARIEATPGGFRFSIDAAPELVVLAPLTDDDEARVFALLEGGEAWATSALALALGVSQRTAQRSLAALEADGRARSLGKGRARRWLAPAITGFATPLLLPAPPASG